MISQLNIVVLCLTTTQNIVINTKKSRKYTLAGWDNSLVPRWSYFSYCFIVNICLLSYVITIIKALTWHFAFIKHFRSFLIFLCFVFYKNIIYNKFLINRLLQYIIMGKESFRRIVTFHCFIFDILSLLERLLCLLLDF